jgi:hypothetical protein
MLFVVNTNKHKGIYNNDRLILELMHENTFLLHTFFKRDYADWFFAMLAPSKFLVINLETLERFYPVEKSGFYWLDVQFSPDGKTLFVEGMIPNCDSEYIFFDLSNPNLLVGLPLRPDLFLESRGDLVWVEDGVECVYEQWRMYCTKFNKWEWQLTADEMLDCYEIGQPNVKISRYFESQLYQQYVLYKKGSYMKVANQIT